MMDHNIDSNFEALDSSARAAKASLSVKSGGSKWMTAWRVVVVIGIIVVIVQFGIVQAQQGKIINEHSGQLTELQNDVDSHHSVSYPLLVNICEHVAGCVVPQ